MFGILKSYSSIAFVLSTKDLDPGHSNVSLTSMISLNKHLEFDTLAMTNRCTLSQSSVSRSTNGAIPKDGSSDAIYPTHFCSQWPPIAWQSHHLEHLSFFPCFPIRTRRSFFSVGCSSNHCSVSSSCLFSNVAGDGTLSRLNSIRFSPVNVNNLVRVWNISNHRFVNTHQVISTRPLVPLLATLASSSLCLEPDQTADVVQ